MKAATAITDDVLPKGSISIHAAREGGDGLLPCAKTPDHLFQSTPPVKAATEAWQELCERAEISIHAAREGGDVRQRSPAAKLHHFNPRRP